MSSVKTKLAPAVETNRQYEYRVVAVEDAQPQRCLNSHAEDGWECFSVTNGGFDRVGRGYRQTVPLFLRRQRRS